MGGKNKASAAAAAAAMQKAGLGSTGFVGFDAFSAVGSNSAGFGTGQSDSKMSALYEGTLDEARTAFKSLSKKDTYTKAKLLQELEVLVKNEGIAKEEVRAMWRHFLYQYTRISRLADPRLRERGAVLLECFALRVPKLVQKSSSLYLCELLCSLGDSANLDVRRAARGAFDAVAPTKADKTKLFENGWDQVSKSIANLIMPEIGTLKNAEEKEAAGRLQGDLIGGTVSVFELVDRETFILLVGQILKSDNRASVWKALLTNQTDDVRAQACQLASTLAREAILELDGVELFDKTFCIQLCNVLGKETAAQVLARCMDAVLSVIDVLGKRTGEDQSDFFQVVGDYRKTFFPALWKLMKDGSRGVGSPVYQYFLPLLSMIPARIWDDFNAQVLASKWLEELWSAMLVSDTLGPHVIPALLRAYVECIAFLLKSGKAVESIHVSRVLEYFLSESQRFKVGKDLPVVLKMALAHLPPNSSVWEAIQSCLVDGFRENSTKANRVAEVIVASGSLQKVTEIARELVLEFYLSDNSSVRAIGAIFPVANVSVSEIDADALAARLAGSQHEPEYLQLLLRLVENSDHGSQLWRKFWAGTAPSSANGTVLNALGDALGLVFSPGATAITVIVDDLQTCINAKVVEALVGLGWLTKAHQQELFKQCSTLLETFIDSVFQEPTGGEIIPESSDLICEAATISRFLGEESPKGVAHALIAQEIEGVPLPNFQTCSDQVKAELKAWLRECTQQSSSDWMQVPEASATWARLASWFGDTRELLCNFQGPPDRLVLTAMHVSEEVLPGECLGFDEPPSLLWKLIWASSAEHDWRDAVLIPYVIADQDRFLKVVANGVELDELDLDCTQPLLQAASRNRAEVFDECVDAVLWPAVAQERVSLKTLLTTVSSAGMSLKRQGLLTQLSELYAQRVVQCIPQDKHEKVRERADVLAQDYMSQDGIPDKEPEIDVSAGHGDAEVDGNTAAVVPVSEREEFAVDEEVIYLKGGDEFAGVVKAVHLDDPSEAYYTVELKDRELQTTAARLRAKLVKPKTLEELNQLLAQARKNGDHKESLRLMKLQPTLVPKPVDSFDARKQALEAARARRLRAQEELTKARRRLGTVGDGGGGGGDGRVSQTSLGEASEKAQANEGPVPISQLSRREQHLLSAERLEALAIVLGRDWFAGKVEREELGSLMLATLCLEYIAPPQAITMLFRAYDPADSMTNVVRGVLRLLRVTSVYFGADELGLPEEVSAYLERSTMACLTNFQSAPELSHLSCDALASLPDTSAELERPYKIVLDETCNFLQGAENAVKPEKGMCQLLERVPCSLVLETEKARSGSLIELFGDLKCSSQLFLSCMTLLQRCCKESDELVAEWWGFQEKIFQAVPDQTSEVLPLNPTPWCILLNLVRKIRVIEPHAKETIGDRIQDLGVVPGALRWSLLSEDFDTDPLKQLVALLTLRVLPVLSRRWYTDSVEVRRSDFDKIRMRLRKVIAERIAQEEMDEILAANRAHLFETALPGEVADETELGTISVSTSIKSRAVIALYEKEDCSVEIRISLPPAFPLDPVTVEGTKQVGLQKDRWQRIVLQMTTMLSSQDATLLDAVLFWKFNMDKEFEGMEPCPICYAVAHAVDRSLPKLRCKTCKNCFHSMCLVKWFKTSHKNDCPLCKQPF
eukprot:CAMPEP_0184535852 /NCGR_PEP_ID=MMETSP0198_2-20121128/16112_1 /TAXON_ID=1112570 /ORGANISM="Thraustochytrium sp., Strain LLF1b" /LENGTH=1658 /DNA_ID=CAMNT_0026928925 /DNA_START=62 /DNA_END=5037 /DNA_ORIENTATION=-